MQHYCEWSRLEKQLAAKEGGKGIGRNKKSRKGLWKTLTPDYMFLVIKTWAVCILCMLVVCIAFEIMMSYDFCSSSLLFFFFYLCNCNSCTFSLYGVGVFSLHWSLVIICIPDKKEESGPIVLHLDSLGLHSSRSVFHNIKRWDKRCFPNFSCSFCQKCRVEFSTI